MNNFEKLVGSVELSNNWLLGYLQLCGWIFLNPSAWRAFVAGIDPSLSPMFSILELKSYHWKNVQIKHLFIYVFIISPIISGIISGTCVFLFSPLLGGTRIGWYLLGGAYAFFIPLIVGSMHSFVSGIGFGILLSIGISSIPDQAGGLMYGVWIASGVPGILTIMHSSSKNDFKAGVLKRSFLATCLTIALVAVAIYAANFSIHGTKIAQGSGNWFVAILGGSLFGVVYTIVSLIRFKKIKYSFCIGFIFLVVGSIDYYVAMAQRQAGDPFLNISAGIAGSLLFGGLFCLAYSIAEKFAGVTVGGIIGSIVCAVAWVPIYPYITSDKVPLRFLEHLSTNFMIGLLAVGLGLSSTYWRPFLTYIPSLLWNRIILSIQQYDKNPKFLFWNCAFWDEFYYTPPFKLYGLDQHLILISHIDKDFAKKAIEYLSTGHQRWAAQLALLEIIALELQNCQNITDIANYNFTLLNSKNNSIAAWFESFYRISFDVNSAINLPPSMYQHQALVHVGQGLEQLSNSLTLSTDKQATRFQPIAAHWSNIVSKYTSNLTENLALSQELDNPYIAAQPLENHSVFVGREEVFQRIQNMLIDQRRPPLFIYGQRRMGKTSLLFNLARHLPVSAVPLFIDGEGLSGATDYADFFYSCARQIVRSAEHYRNIQLKYPQRTDFEIHPISNFQDWLDNLENTLKQKNCTMGLLIFDELEAITNTLNRLNNEDLMHVLRHIIQHKPYFKILLASSYPLSTYKKLAGYLINIQTIKIGYLKIEEAEHLITKPIPDFGLKYQNEALDFILSVTRCHPYLIQAVCSELIMLKNMQEPGLNRKLATLDDTKKAVEQTLNSAVLYFMGVMNLVENPELSLLQDLANLGSKGVFSNTDILKYSSTPNKIIERLTQLDVLEKVNDKYRFQIEMHRLWFNQLDINS